MPKKVIDIISIKKEEEEKNADNNVSVAQQNAKKDNVEKQDILEKKETQKKKKEDVFELPVKILIEPPEYQTPKIQTLKHQAPKTKISQVKAVKTKTFKTKTVSLRKSLLKWFSVAAPVLGFIFLGVIIFLSSQARLSLRVYPAFDNADTTEEVKISASQNNLDIQQKIIPGLIFETEEEKISNFKSSGTDSKGGKAGGAVLLYNSYSPPTPLALRVQTRLLSSKEGKIFKSAEKINLPAATMQGGKIIPSVTEVKVFAQAEGPDYNIGSSNFSVPGLAGTAWYYSIWGESKAKMEGGSVTEVKVVTEKDLTEAKAALKKELEGIAKASLKNKTPEGVLLQDSMVAVEDFQFSCAKEEGAEASDFNCYGKIKVKGLGCRKSELLEMGRQLMISKLPSLKKVDDPSLNFEIISKSTITQAGNMVADFKVKGRVYEEVQSDLFLLKIKNKKKEQIEKLIKEDFPQIKNIEFKFSPFWIKKAPSSIEKIKLEWVLN